MSTVGSVAVLSAIRALYAAAERFPEVARDALGTVFGAADVAGFVCCTDGCLHHYGADAPFPVVERFHGDSRIEWRGPNALLCADHGEERGRSVWLLREPAPRPLRRYGDAVLANLAQAGQINLPRVEGDGPCHLSVRPAAPPARPVQAAAAAGLLAGLGAEAQVAVRLAARGWNNHQIAQRMGLSVGSVSRRLRAAYRHLGIKSRWQLPLEVLLAHGPVLNNVR